MQQAVYLQYLLHSATATSSVPQLSNLLQKGMGSLLEEMY